MNYQITITKTEPNPNYDKELAFYETEKNYASAYSYEKPKPQTEVIRDVLICELTEEQFKRIKAEALKVFE